MAQWLVIFVFFLIGLGGHDNVRARELAELDNLGCNIAEFSLDNVARGWIGVDDELLTQAQIDEAVTAMEQSVARHGDAACSVMKVLEQGLYGERLGFDPAVWAAQATLVFSGCSTETPTGILTPETTAAWARAGENGALPALSSKLSADDAAALIATASTPLCGPNEQDAVLEPGRLLPIMALANCDDWDLGAPLTYIFSELGGAPQQWAMQVLWSRWCNEYDEALHQQVIELTRNGGDAFQTAPPLARFRFGVDMATDPELADLKAFGLQLIEASDSPEARAFVYSARAAGLIEAVPPSLVLTESAHRNGVESLDAFGVYALFKTGEMDAADAARLMALSTNGAFAREEDAARANDYDVSYSLDALMDIVRLAEVMMADPSAADAAMAAGQPEVLLALGHILLEGYAPGGRDANLAVRTIQAAAEGGLAAAQYRFAIARLNGLGGARNPGEALDYLKRAAEGGHARAIVQLAALKEAGPQNPATIRQAQELYEQLPDLAANGEILGMVRSRIMAGSPFFNAEKGRRVLEQIIDREGSELSDQDIANTYLCVDCGTTVNMAEGLWWLRRGAQHSEQPYELAAILLRSPEQQVDPMELQRLMETMEDDLATLLRPIFQPGPDDRERLNAAFEQICVGPYVRSYCTIFAHDLAVGRFSARLAATGLAQLRRLFVVDRDEPNVPSTYVSWALMDAYAFYGEAAEALAVFPPESMLDQSGEFRARDQTLRRLVNQLRSAPDAERHAPVAALLDQLAAADDIEAEALRELLDYPITAAVPEIPDLATATERYAAQASRGGISRSLANGARSLADALVAEQKGDEALRYELIALQVDRRLNTVMAATVGPLPAALADSCAMSHTAERLDQFGYPGLAIAVAKLAVNRLQEVRRDMVDIQHNLQVCFAAVVSDSYRSLADLLIRNERLDEAQLVLASLQDFETFTYFGHDPQVAGDALREFPLSAGEIELLDLVDAIDPPMTEMVLRRKALQQKGEDNLSATERAELALLDTRIEEEAARTVAVANTIVTASAEAPRDLHAQLVATKGRLRREFEGQAAVLYYAVLPDRMHAILVTPSALRSHTWASLDGQPFDENVLNARIARFRGALQHKRSDPDEDAEWFFDLLVQPFWEEIIASGASELFVSPDRQLRLVPFSTLRANDHYLVERFDIATVSRNSEPNAPADGPVAHIAALGVATAPPGYEPLPGVTLELDGLVADANGYGLFDGEMHLDDDFTLQTLINAVNRQGTQPHALLHIASHFVLGSDEASSYLLLGRQSSLSLAALRQEIISENLDFGTIDLVTLSACQTAVSPQDSGGEQLASLASLFQRYARRSVMATLWSVSDQSTALFTQRFYEIWLANPDRRPAWALSRTMREFITGQIGGANPQGSVVAETARKSGLELGDGQTPQALGFDHPYFWAPFVLFQGG
jgi:CHAT domain-containing protein/TPR repeat protein